MVILINKTNKIVITKELKIANSFIDRNLGLLLKSNPRFLLFYTRFGIHTFGLKEPIDIVILNNKKKVVSLKKNLKPNRLFLWNPQFNIVIELPKNSIENKIKIGSVLKFG